MQQNAQIEWTFGELGPSHELELSEIEQMPFEIAENDKKELSNS